MNEEQIEALKVVVAYAKGKSLVDKHHYRKDFPNKPELDWHPQYPDGIQHDILETDIVEKAGGMGNIHQHTAKAIKTLREYLGSTEGAWRPRYH